jgi:molybdate-binding protein
VLCWVAFYNVQETYTYARYEGQNVSRSTIEFLDKQPTAAQQRYFRAMEGLARIRKLSIDVVQMNIAANGGQQINMAMSTPAGEDLNLINR